MNPGQDPLFQKREGALNESFVRGVTAARLNEQTAVPPVTADGKRDDAADSSRHVKATRDYPMMNDVAESETKEQQHENIERDERIRHSDRSPQRKSGI